MKSQDSVPLTVKLLGRDYQVSCPKDERDHLLASARYLDDRMQAIRKRAAGLGVERIAVMTALNMAREMMDRDAAALRQAAPSAPANDDEERAHQLQLRIEAELGPD